MQTIGAKIRRARLRQVMTLDELAQRTDISKAYLSLIETGRVTNPPSDQKLQRLESALGFPQDELVRQAHLHRTPRDVRIVLHELIRQQSGEQATDGKRLAAGISLDDAYLSGLLQAIADRASADLVEATPSCQPIAVGEARTRVPIVNKVSAGYPKDFTDLSYPPRHADAYITAPGVDDPDAFAARVFGDSMSPKYSPGDIVIFSPTAAWKDGADCFVRFEDGQTTFKRVYAEQNAGGKAVLRLQPRNPRYTPRVIARESVSGVYRAVSCYRNVSAED